MSYDIGRLVRMDTFIVASDKVRVPDLAPGTAAAVHRYHQERAYLLHPADFHRLAALEQLAASALALPPLTLSPAAISAHVSEGSPGTSITDPARLAALLGTQA